MRVTYFAEDISTLTQKEIEVLILQNAASGAFPILGTDQETLIFEKTELPLEAYHAGEVSLPITVLSGTTNA
jgi:hypothetical protein